MAAMLRHVLVALLLSIGFGLVLGEATVDAMQVRRMPATDVSVVNTSLIDDGLRWAKSNRPAHADSCPQPTLLFQWGCVMATSN